MNERELFTTDQSALLAHGITDAQAHIRETNAQRYKRPLTKQQIQEHKLAVRIRDRYNAGDVDYTLLKWIQIYLGTTVDLNARAEKETGNDV